MTDDKNGPGTPPITKPPYVAPASPSRTPTAPTATAPAGVTRTSLIVIGVAIVVLSFVASFLGATLARSGGDAEPAPVATAEPTASPTPPDTGAYEEALKEILPAGSAVRAGAGAPASGKGYEGEVYIDLSTADVYLFRDGDWVKVGNIRTSAAENLTGETGATGETGETGAPGAPGTQVLLGVGAPTNETCQSDGDVYIDTATVTFYECAAGAWTPSGPTAQVPQPTPTTDSNG
ncbi:hypothetical protein [Microbacterium sp. NPDC064584]|uniref:hypothetical protein n=1 Tax=Microbacterium sp. NPDC064584 TaxID=3155817 RepID=UPI00343FF0BF